MNKFIGDLHCHSVYSDGAADVDQIVDFAKRAKLTHLALTDHDTLAGIEEIQTFAKKQDLNIIPGVEITTWDYKRNRDVHLLCYYPKKDSMLLQVLNSIVSKRHKSKMDVIEKIVKDYPIKSADVDKARGKSVAIHQPHIIRALAEMGYTSIVNADFVDSIFGKNSKYFTPYDYPDIMDVTKLLKKLNCPAVIAHPGQFDSIELILELCKEKLLTGIECFHPRNSKQTIDKCCAIADEYNLIKTGGSDYHSYYSKKPRPIATCTTDHENLIRLMEYS